MTSSSPNSTLEPPKQTRLWGRDVKVKIKKAKKMKEETGLSINHITASMLRDYLKCPRLFYYRYILKIKFPKKPMPLVFGGAVHNAIEEFYKGGNALAKFETEFIRDDLEFDEEMPPEQQDALYLENKTEGERLLRIFTSKETQDYLQTVHDIGPEGRCEESFRVWWKDPIDGTLLPISVTGRYDKIVEEKDRIIEIKTSKKPYKQSEIDTSVQGSVYPMSYLSEYKRPAKEVVYIVLIKGRKEPIQVLKTTRTKEQLSQAFKQAELVLQCIKSNQYERGTGFLHKYCDCYKYDKALLIPHD